MNAFEHRSDQELERLQKLEKIRALGIEPYPADAFPTSHTCRQVKESFRDEEAENWKKVRLAGRLMSIRDMGKALFAELMDASGRLQIYLRRDDLIKEKGEAYFDTFIKKLLDIGDIVGVQGFVFRTRVGEVTLHVEELRLLAKAVRPLPIVKVDEQGHVYDAFNDPEKRQRMRYVDLLVNPGVRETFLKRTAIIRAMREFLDSHGCIEVETPILQPIPGGAAARPFVTHHNALDIPLYLRIANELYLKRLIAGGFERVYEFAKDFRNEGIDRTHNPEFTMMEVYVAYQDYQWMMDFTEAMLEHVVSKVFGTTEITYQGQTLNFQRPFRRITLREAIMQYAGLDFTQATYEDLRSFCRERGLKHDASMGRGKLIDEIFSELCEHHFQQPTFIMDYPVEMSPLCKKHRKDPTLAERFELIITGKEIANAYSELNDPLDQLERFKEQARLKEAGDDEAMFVDYDFVRALEFGMPPTAGMGIGIDRLVMILTDQDAIQEVLFFPQLRPESPAGA